MLRRATVTVQPGDLLRLDRGWTPGVGNSLPYMGLSVVAYEVIRVIGDEVHLFGIDTFTRRMIAVEAELAIGKLSLEECRAFN